MNVDSKQLPLSIRDWPVVVGNRTPSGYVVDRDKWCNDRRGGWYCSRETGHALPHVASDGYSTLAVWDQQYYGDHRWKLPMRVLDVISDRRVSSSGYNRAKIELPVMS